MQYLKLKAGNTTIEFHNNWGGVETVIANGTQVTKLSSVMGAHHLFTIMEDGELVRYVLTSKVSPNMQVLIDLKRNGDFVHENVPLKLGSRPINKYKKEGLKFLLKYDMKKALDSFTKAADIESKDPTIYFHMACAFSNLEDVEKGFFYLKKAVECNLPDHELILNHDMLAFLRMRSEFDAFIESGFTHYVIEEDANPIELRVRQIENNELRDNL